MATDVFNNPSNDYVYPALSPCAGASDDSYFQFLDEGVGIVSGSGILAKMDFSNLKIPVSAYSMETKIISEGEVIYIPGLTKGIQKRQQGFLMPNLESTDEDLNSFFFEVDLSVSYYKNFRFYNKGIDVSANYGLNINLEDALNIALGNLGLNITATYDPSVLIFKGTVDGYEFTVSNVILSIIDASMNANSPFEHYANADYYLLEESEAYDRAYAKYPNGGMQGLIMRGIYPSTTPMTPYDKWLYLVHATDYVIVYEPVVIDNFISDVSAYLRVRFDASTQFGCGITDPSISLDSDISTFTFNYDISIGEVSLVDGSDYINDEVIDGSTLDNYNLIDCSINNSVITNSYIFGFLTSDSSLVGVSINSTNVINSIIADSSILGGVFVNSFIVNSDSEIGLWNDVSVFYSRLFDTDLISGNIYWSLLQGDSSFLGNMNSLKITDSSIKNYIIGSSVISGSYLLDSSLQNTDITGGIIDFIHVADSSLLSTEVLDSSLSNVSLTSSYAARSSVMKSNVFDSSIVKSTITDSSLFSNVLPNYLQDSSAYSSYFENTEANRVHIGQSDIIDSIFEESFFGECSIDDSSIIGGSIINKLSVVTNCLIVNSWTNTWKLFVGTDPCLGPIYEYVMSDYTLPIDTSLYTVIINDSEIWDSSINNAVLNDCSIFRCFLQDVSLNNCTIYNTVLDPDFYDSVLDTNRIILIDPSIQNAIELTFDSSTYYQRIRKKLEVGMNGCSSPNVMTGGDYLDWVTTNDFWNKFGDLYMWTTAPDGCEDCHNLLDGFYVYNPHTFSCKIEYMLFI
jgi:hypothetical protein